MHQTTSNDTKDEPAITMVHQDETCWLLNKPAGLLSVPGRGDLQHDSLAQRLQRQHPEARIVHRLDMATSGLILIANGPHWQRVYSRLFAQRWVHKQYVAVVSGCVSQDDGEINLPLSADWPNRPKQRIDPIDGKPSLTRYRVLIRYPKELRTRLLLEPVTGRSHQLRVHLLALGHPIIGDQLYAPTEVGLQSTRLLLHSQRLALTHPASNEATVWQCPADF